MSQEREIEQLKGRISALKDALALSEARNDFLNSEIDRLKKRSEIVSRKAPSGAAYGYRWDDASQRYWAVTVPHEHGPFSSAAEADAFLREDSLPA